jgi:hypothetical protein
MTDEQVNRTAQHLREQLHLAVRLKGTEALPPNAKDLAFDAAIVRTVLLTGGITMNQAAQETTYEPAWS